MHKVPSGPPEYVVEYQHDGHIDSTLPMSAKELTDFLSLAPSGKTYTVQTLQPYKIEYDDTLTTSWDEHR